MSNAFTADRERTLKRKQTPQKEYILPTQRKSKEEQK